MIEIENVSKKFNDEKVLSNVSFSLDNGKFMVLLEKMEVAKVFLLKLFADFICQLMVKF